jgi:hypothetical protein
VPITLVETWVSLSGVNFASPKSATCKMKVYFVNYASNSLYQYANIDSVYNDWLDISF